MRKLELTSKIYPTRVEIPVRFIDIFMPSASVEEIKVYLYLVRASQDTSVVLSLDDMADLFDFTPNKIRKALYSLSSQGLVLLDEARGDISGITLLPCDNDTAPDSGKTPGSASSKGISLPEDPEEPESSSAFSRQVQKETPSVSALSSEKKSASEAFPIDINSLYEEEDFNELLSVTEMYMGGSLSSVQKDGVAFCYLLFDRQVDIAIYLIEYCIERNHPTFTYIKTVANDWKKRGFSSLEEIKDYVNANNKLVTTVMKAFGITSRSLIKPEMDFVDKWSSDFDLELIKEACERTVLSINNPSFKYADSILSAWKASGIKTIDEVRLSDKAFEGSQKKDDGKKKEDKAQKSASNQFHNFKQRDTDYNKLIPSFFDK